MILTYYTHMNVTYVNCQPAVEVDVNRQFLTFHQTPTQKNGVETLHQER